jgi:hypothetical protein
MSVGSRYRVFVAALVWAACSSPRNEVPADTRGADAGHTDTVSQVPPGGPTGTGGAVAAPPPDAAAPPLDAEAPRPVGPDGAPPDNRSTGCGPGYHACGQTCARNDAVESCGTACSPCPPPPGPLVRATCDGIRCALACAAGAKACGDRCVPAGGCCDDAACTVANASGICRLGQCALVGCNAGFADCDPARAGCETPLDTRTDCGACGHSCTGSEIDSVCAPGPGCVPLDQRSEGPDPGNVTINTPRDGYRAGQTFTSGRSGTLVAVRLHLLCVTGTGIDLEVQSTTGGLPTERVMARASYACQGQGGTDGEAALIPFAQPASVVAGVKLALVVSSTGPSIIQELVYRGINEDRYPRGDSMGFGFTPGAWTITPGGNWDWLFETYVAP